MNARERQNTLQKLASEDHTFDVIVVGGGITGAGIAREAAGSGLSVLLVEQRDFAWGTSSRSSKMVHGGLRYLGSGQYRLTRDAVRERQRLMQEAPGLIDPLQFIMPHFRRQFPGLRLFGLLLRVYDWIAGRRSRLRLSPAETLSWVPGLVSERLIGGSGFTDAVTDDARLVQRTLEEARRAGATCLNYVQASEVLRDQGRVTGLAIRDTATPSSPRITVTAPLVINATGAWAGQLRSVASGIRPLRGSHLVLPFAKLPVTSSVSLLHPDDGRPVFAFPWHGMTVLGTTDLDHPHPLDQEPRIAPEEVGYLLRIAATLFPAHPISRRDIVATWAGVRPVVSRGEGKAASKENREHVIWDDQGLITIAGGKLTTFRLIARETLELAGRYLPNLTLRDNTLPVFSPPSPLERPPAIESGRWQRLLGYYGPELDQVLQAGEHRAIAGTDWLWCELNWALKNADVVHLDDLLLRRTRLGLVLAEGAQQLLPDLRAACTAQLGWDEATWQQEVSRYQAIWQTSYSPPWSRTSGNAAKEAMA